MSLTASFTVGLGDLELCVDLEAPAGAVTAVVGPNGAGKTSLLGVLAGTLAIDSGSVSLASRVLDAPPGTFVPPERRRMGVLHQDHLLFGHLSALDNVAFGPRCSGASVAAARSVARGWLDRLGMAAQAGLRPGALSGGQAQRVALARALASGPEALLLDEPLAALDATTGAEVRRDLRRHLRGFAGPTVLVTHDPLDALTLADHIVVLEGGRVTQAGSVADLVARPRSLFLADLLGVNLVRGVANGTALTTPGGVVVPLAEAHAGEVLVTVPPSAVVLSAPPSPPPPPLANRAQVAPDARVAPDGRGWQATVEDLEVVGDRARVRLGPPLDLLADVALPDVAALGLVGGVAVWVEVDAAATRAYPVADP